MLICFCTVGICQPLSKITETAPIVKMYGESITMQCPYHPCTETAGDIRNFAKVSGGSQLTFIKVESSVKQLKMLMMLSIPHCANTTEPCCVDMQVQ